MIDTRFYRQTYDVYQQMISGKTFSKDEVFDLFEEARSQDPVVYNIETTNACNMKCAMCPRTTMMTRSIASLKRDSFIKIVDQLSPVSSSEWDQWKQFCEKTYGIYEQDMSENHFFLYIIPKVIQLHGYGDPLLDKNMVEYVSILREKGFQSYFSCNPANINVELTTQMFESGLDYIKYSIESVDDETHKQIRGEASNFSEGYRRIKQLLDIKKEKGFTTTIIITMLDLNRTHQAQEYEKLRQCFEGLNVYIYLKSEDQQWYRKDHHGTQSIHWSEICRHPWMSMTIKSNGEAAMCMEDFNNEIILGDIAQAPLKDIWNSEAYRQFRWDHLNLQSGMKCSEECDMCLAGQYLDQE